MSNTVPVERSSKLRQLVMTALRATSVQEDMLLKMPEVLTLLAEVDAEEARYERLIRAAEALQHHVRALVEASGVLTGAIVDNGESRLVIRVFLNGKLQHLRNPVTYQALRVLAGYDKHQAVRVLVEELGGRRVRVLDSLNTPSVEVTDGANIHVTALTASR